MRFIRMNLGPPPVTATDADRRDAPESTPPAAAVAAPQAGKLADRSTDRNRLDLGDRSDDLEVHLASSLRRSRPTLAVTSRGEHREPRSAGLRGWAAPRRTVYCTV